ncbi:MAG TPA: type II secretion system protein [Candidatus Aminicenantes bacterium]|jgi:hypothetical protein|nr:type II secretion system protein [Candidatus Aminicenantes bacterium]HPN17440.1 type II secretion system protein [Candidatus Aminicenantes bacterium]
MVRPSEAGYTLLILMVFISVMTVALAIALPVLETQGWREKEEELLFRGRQYVEAVRLYADKNPGQYPKSIEELVKGRYLRKAFPEPMTREGKWNLILLPAQAGELGAPGPKAPAARGKASRSRPAKKGEEPEDAGDFAAAEGEPSSLTQVMVVPEKLLSSVDNPRIIGVVSPSGRKSFFIYDKNESYDTWLFFFGRTPGQNPEIIRFGTPLK